MEPSIETIKKKIEEALKAAYPGMFPLLVPAQGRTRIGGMIIWDQFAGLDQMERQKRVWDVLRQDLTPNELLKVGLILTITEQEQKEATIAA